MENIYIIVKSLILIEYGCVGSRTKCYFCCNGLIIVNIVGDIIYTVLGITYVRTVSSSTVVFSIHLLSNRGIFI